MNEQNVRRGIALFIDFFLISMIYSVLANLVPETLISHESVGIQVSFGLGADWFLLVCFFYFFGCDLLNKGESLGKDIMGLQTKALDGRILNIRDRLYRTVLKLVSLVFLLFALLLFFWKERGLTLHDYVVKTAVTPIKRFKPRSL